MSPVIDSHVHLWKRERHPQEWIDPVTMGAIDRDFGLAELRTMLAATGADSAVVVQSTNSLVETADLLALAGDPAVAGVVGWIDLTADAKAQVAGLRESPGGEALSGIRHLTHIERDAAWLLRDDVGRGLSALAGTGLVFDLVLRDYQLPLAASVVRAHPELYFVLDHLGNPRLGDDPAVWRRNLGDLAAEPNVSAKLSGLAAATTASPVAESDVKRVVDAALDAFGPSRLLYGSDYPLVELADGASAWTAALRSMLHTLSSNERDEIFGGTAALAYGARVAA